MKNIQKEVFLVKFGNDKKATKIIINSKFQRKVRINENFHNFYSSKEFFLDIFVIIFFSLTTDSLALTQRLKLERELNVHKGCVNSIVWNETGDKILSGSDDQKLILTNPFTSKIYFKYTTVHKSNIFSAKFLPHSESRIVSCAGNGSVIYTDLSTINFSTEPDTQIPIAGHYRAPIDEANYFSCHAGTTYEVIPIATDPNGFMSCGEDGTVRFYDLRSISQCHQQYCRENILVFAPSSCSAISLSPISNHYLAVGCADYIRIFDRRYLKLVELPTNNPIASLMSYGTEYHTKPVKMFKIPVQQKRPYRVTSLVYSRDEQELLVSFSSEYLYLFDVKSEGVESNGEMSTAKRSRRKRRESPKVLRKLRLRGDWSDTGPDARPLNEISAQSRPQLNSGIMNRMTGLLSRMLNDPRHRQSRNSSNSDESVEDGISMLFNNEESRHNPNNDEASTSSGVTNEESQAINAQQTSSGSSSSSSNSSTTSSSSEDDSTNSQQKFDYVRQKFMGHRNARTMIKEANFWGDDFVSFSVFLFY